MAKKPETTGLWSSLSAMHPRAPATTLLVITCVGIWMVIQQTGVPETAAQWAQRGVYTAEEIRAGKWWGLWSACLVHVALWHLVFNVYWLWLLGSRIEREIGTWKYVALTVVGAALSSLTQVVTEGGAGHGYSGVVYALFGFAWIASPRYPSFREVLSPNTVAMLLIWLVACVVLTQTGAMAIANGAHFGGLICGASIAYGLVRGNLPGKAGFAAFVLFLAVGWFWRPWSPDWSAQRALEAQRAGDMDAAQRWYRMALFWGGDERSLRQNLALAYMVGKDDEAFESVVAKLEGEDRSLARTLRTNRDDYVALRAALEKGPPERREFLRARLAMFEWRFADARQILEAILREAPDDAGALTSFALATVADEESSRAELARGLEHAAHAVELTARRDPASLDLCARLAARLGDSEKAGEWADAIVALAGRTSVPREYLDRAEEFRAARDRGR